MLEEGRVRVATVTATSPMKLVVMTGHDLRAISRDMPEVLGKLRATIEVPVGTDEAEVFARAEAEENVRRAIGERPVRKRIHVPGRVVNFVV